MIRKLVILGAGGNAYDSLDVIDAINGVSATWEVEGILDDGKAVGSMHCGLPILGPLARATELSARWFTSSIWSERTFQKLQSILEATRLPTDRFASLVHPGACVSARATLGRGVIVNFGASIAGNVRIGDFVSIGPLGSIGHDSVLDGCTAIAAGAIVSGGVHIEQNCYVGSNASIRQQLRVGARSLVGMGAVVVADVPVESVVVGNPARPLRSEKTRRNGEQHAE